MRGASEYDSDCRICRSRPLFSLLAHSFPFRFHCCPVSRPARTVCERLESVVPSVQLIRVSEKGALCKLSVDQRPGRRGDDR